ncbi:MAG: hypothetical protein GXO75_16550, partial [Calditrichaeota bacterium]|nr:hypothetical protein [Calditrichota bacterium]
MIGYGHIDSGACARRPGVNVSYSCHGCLEFLFSKQENYLTFFDRLKQGIVLFDGAMGTQIQVLDPTEEEWGGKEGCT